MPHTNPFFELSAEALCILDTQNCILYTNEAMEEFIQNKKQNLVGKNFIQQLIKKNEEKNDAQKLKKQLEKAQKQINVKVVEDYFLINNKVNTQIRAIATQKKQIYISINNTDTSYLNSEKTAAKYKLAKNQNSNKITLQTLQKELSSTKKMLQFVLDSLPDGVIFTSPDSEIEWINPSIKKLLGYKEEEYTGKILSTLFEEDSFLLISEATNNLEKTAVFEITLKTKNGKLIYTETISTPVYGFNNSIIGYLYVVRDVSEHKIFEKEKTQIMRSLAQFKRTLDVTKDSVFMFDSTNLLFIYANKGATQAVGYTFDELRKMKLTDLMSDINSKDFEQLISYLINNAHHQINIDSTFLHKNKTKFPVALLLQYVDLDNGKNRFVAIVRDISERKITEKLLKKSELKFRSTFEQAGIGIAHIGIDLSWATFNAHFCKMTGYSSAELSVKKLREITHPKDLPRDITQLGRVLSRKSDGYSMKIRYIHKNGDVIWLNLSLSIVKDEDKKPVFIVMFIENISEQVEAEKILQETLNELKRSNYELDQFVYKASHDLRSPITSILGLLNIAEIDEEHALAHIKKIRGRIQKLDEFIQSIINYSQTNNLEPQLEPLQIEYLIHKNIAELDFLPYASEIKFKVKQKQKGAIYMDNLRLNIILKNLLSNAIKFADRTKKVSIILIETDVRKDKKFVLTITDNGLGIDEAYQEQIFDMFYRGNEVFEGNGLGLYILRQAVEKLGGELKFASQLGKGSKFIVILPNLKPQMKEEIENFFISPTSKK